MQRLLLFLLMLVALVSCSERKRTYVIGVSSCSNDMWREKLNEEMTLSTYQYDNVELRIQSANDDDKRQIEQINRFVDEGVDLLIVSPNQLKTISSAIDRAHSKHVPVVLFDRKTDTEKYTAFIGADNFKVGRDMGEFVAKRMNGRGRLVVIKGLRGSSAAIERDSGFMSVISHYPDIVIVGSGYAGWFQSDAVNVMDSILQSTTDIDLVFAQNDRMAIGARRAVEKRGIKRHIDYVGVDALPVKGGGLECVNTGRLAASYIYPTRGDLVIGLAMDILEGRPYKRNCSLTGALVTSDNAGVLLLQNDELTKQRERLYALHGMVNKYLAEYSHQRIYAALAVVIIVLLLVSFAMVYRTVLVRRRLEAQATDAKLTFFTNVSHEFRTPLTLIADPVDRLLADRSLGDGQRSLLRLARKNVDVMLRLVGEILDFRKVQKGKMTLRLSRFDLADALRQWTEGFLPVAERKNIDLEIVANEEIDMVADHDKLAKVVYNLLSNAMKYTPSGGHVKLSAVRDGDNAIVKVSDDGQGMTADEAKHVFDRFYQTGNAVGGTGIGLALVKAFTEMHHGDIAVESKPGKGSTFTMTIPLVQDGEITEGQPASEMSPNGEADEAVSLEGAEEQSGIDRITSLESQDEQKPMVLVIDDNDDVRGYVASLLASGYDVRQADNGTTGLERAMSEVPDIVICDVMMPGIDGLEVCRRLKAETATSHIPVILLTARTMDDQRVEGYDCGADAYITKPFSAKVLLARVKNLLDTRQKLKRLYTSDDAPTTERDDADSRFMHDFNRLVLARMSDASLSVEDISAGLGLSRVQMYRKVKALTGSSPVELIRIMRLKKADRLLKQGGRTVSEVSYDVGFASPSYFAKCFKSFFGRLPSE